MAPCEDGLLLSFSYKYACLTFCYDYFLFYPNKQILLNAKIPFLSVIIPNSAHRLKSYTSTHCSFACNKSTIDLNSEKWYLKIH